MGDVSPRKSEMFNRMLNMMTQTSKMDKSMVIWLTYRQEHEHEHDSETLRRKDD
jgi:hypothetical protein